MLPILISCAMCHECDLYNVIKRANDAYIRDMKPKEDVQNGDEVLDEDLEWSE